MTLGKTLEEIRAMPAPDYLRYRRFYRRQPFGPVWDVMTAWLAGYVGRQGFSKKPTTLTEALAMLTPNKPKRSKKKEPPKLATEKPGWVKEFARGMGVAGI